MVCEHVYKYMCLVIERRHTHTSMVGEKKGGEIAERQTDTPTETERGG